MNIENLRKNNEINRYYFVNVAWILCVGYFIFKLVSLFVAPDTFPIPVQVKEIVANETVTPVNEIYNLKIERGKFKLYLKDKGTIIPTIYYLNAALFLLYIVALTYMGYQAKLLSHNIYKRATFKKSNVKYLKNIGRTLAAIGFLYPLLQRKITASAISGVNFPNVILSSQIQTEWLYYIVGILFLIIAYAFEKGFELKEETELTI